MTVPVVSSSTLAEKENAGFAGFVSRLSAPSAPTGSMPRHRFAGNATTGDDILSCVSEAWGFALGETTQAVQVGLSDALTVETNGSLYPYLTQPTIAPFGVDFATAPIDAAREHSASTLLVFAQRSS